MYTDNCIIYEAGVTRGYTACKGVNAVSRWSSL